MWSSARGCLIVGSGATRSNSKVTGSGRVGGRHSPVGATLAREPFKKKKLVTLLGLFLLAPLGHAETINWATWTLPPNLAGYGTKYDLTGVPGTSSTGALYDLDPIRSGYTTGVAGSVVNPVGGATIGLSVSGEISSYSSAYFNWSTRVPAAAGYVGSIPTFAAMLAQTGYSTAEYKPHTLSFDAPVSNVLMLIFSLGAPGEASTLTFSQPFQILSSQNVFTSGVDGKGGYTLTGFEGNGLIQFLGTYSSLSWDVSAPEVFSGFNVGFTSTPYIPPAPVPAPPALWLFVLGLLGIGAIRRKRVMQRMFHTGQYA